MILMSIGHLFHNDDLNSKEDDLRLLDDLDNNEEVVSEKSVFFNFLPTRDKEEKTKGNNSQ